MTFGEFAGRCGGKLAGLSPSATFSGFSLDSREVSPNSLFLCIRGERSDGHDFAETAMRAGATGCVAEREVPAPHVRVERLVDALARYAASIREEYQGPVVAITGSNGKTSTKEFAAAALAPLGPILKSPGNRNTEYTVPLLWHELRPDHCAVVTELAMRGLGQIDHLARFTKPTVAIVTMIGTAHLEMVGSREGIARAKAELLAHLDPAGHAIFWAEDDFLPTLKAASPAPFQTFGFSPDADLVVMGYRPVSWRASEARLEYRGQSAPVHLPTVGKHQALNAAAAVLAAVHCGVEFREATAGVSHAALPPMRMEIREWRGVTIVLDNYNASPDSAVAALRTLCELPTGGRKVAVLGEMKELGNASESGHRLLGKALVQTEPDQVLLYGEQTRFIREEAENAGLPSIRLRSVTSLEEISEVIRKLEPGDTVLIKGSRALELEKSVEVLA